jgi:hypothetical protein
MGNRFAKRSAEWRALAVAPNIEFYRYEVNFKLIKTNVTGVE